jgi:prolyl oligopeptidase
MELSGNQNRRFRGYLFRQDIQRSLPLAGKSQDKEVETWFKSQAELTDALLAKIPGRDALVDEWTALDKLNPASYSAISYENGRVFYKKTLGGENVGKLYFREGWNGAEKLLFDPGTYKPGVVMTIESIVPSWDGKHVAMGFSSGGAEYSEIRILDVGRGVLLPEKVLSVVWPDRVDQR